MYSAKKRKFEKITRSHVQPLELIYLQLQQLISKVDKLEKIKKPTQPLELIYVQLQQLIAKVDKLEKIVAKKCESNSKHKMQYNYYG